MKQLRPLIMMIIVVLAAAAYVGGIIYAGIASLGSTDEPVLPDIVTQAVIAIGGVLGTHFGAVFGIRLSTSGAPQPIHSLLKLKAWAKPPQRDDSANRLLSWLQNIAVCLYPLSLLGAAVFWLADGFSPDTAQVIRNMSYTFLGVVVGTAAVALNVE